MSYQNLLMINPGPRPVEVRRVLTALGLREAQITRLVAGNAKSILVGALDDEVYDAAKRLQAVGAQVQVSADTTPKR
jgi:ribosomal protein L7/L12